MGGSAVLAVALAVAPVTAGQAAAPADGDAVTARVEAALHDGVLTTTSSLDRSAAALDVFDPRDPRTLLDVTAALAGQDGEGQAGNAELVIESDPADESVYRFLQVVGDLDGDDVADTLVSTYRFPQDTSTIEARRGADGTRLWRLDGGSGAYAQNLPDVTGDGVDDLVLVSLAVTDVEEEGGCDDGCHFEGSATYRWTYGLTDGATGTPMWSQTLDGGYRYTSDDDGPGSDASYSYTGSNVVLGVQPVAAGSALRLLVSAADVDDQYADTQQDPTGTGLGLVSQRRSTSSVRSDVRASIVGAVDGAVLLTREVADVQGLPFLMSAGDLVGDSADDVLWTVETSTDGDVTCTSAGPVTVACDGDERTSALVTEVLDGSTLQTAWTAAVDSPFGGFSFPLGADLDSDGRADLLELTAHDTTLGFELRSTLRSGANGQVVWSAPGDDWVFPIVIDDLDGDADTDLLTVAYSYDEAADAVRTDLIRLDGRTGQELRRTTAPSQPTIEGDCFASTFTYAAGMPDADADGVADALVGGISEAFSCDGGVETQHLLYGESGARDVQLLRRSGPGVLFGYAAGDLDGDGRPELLLEDTTTTTAATLPQLTTLWTIDEADGFSFPAGTDLDGDGLLDLIMVGFEETEDRFELTTGVRRGADGQPLWQVPDVRSFSRAR